MFNFMLIRYFATPRDDIASQIQLNN